MSIMNLAEVLQKFRRENKPIEGLVGELEIAGMKWDAPALLDTAVVAEMGKMKGISLADRFCIALAVRLGAPVLTADRKWADHPMPARIEFIR
jgi:PIN domain nuclease of toxin-antitoxin system